MGGGARSCNNDAKKRKKNEKRIQRKSEIARTKEMKRESKFFNTNFIDYIYTMLNRNVVEIQLLIIT